MKKTLYAVTLTVLAAFVTLVIYGLSTQCPDVAVYVHCPEGSR